MQPSIFVNWVATESRKGLPGGECMDGIRPGGRSNTYAQLPDSCRLVRHAVRVRRAGSSVWRASHWTAARAGPKR